MPDHQVPDGVGDQLGLIELHPVCAPRGNDMTAGGRGLGQPSVRIELLRDGWWQPEPHDHRTDRAVEMPLGRGVEDPAFGLPPTR